MCISVLLSKYINWNLAENSVSILFVGDGFPVPLHSSLFAASPNPFGRFSRLLREAKRLPYALTNWNLLSCLGSGVRVDAVRGLAPRIYEGGATSSQTGGGGSPYKRLRSNLRVIPNQSSDWCGNPPRHCDRFLLKMEIATPVCATLSQ